MIPRLRPNLHYYLVHLVIEAEQSVLVYYNNKAEWYRIEEEIEVPDYYLTEEQYSKMWDRLKEHNIAAALRNFIAEYELGHEKYEVDEDGMMIEESWEWIPGYIAPKDFKLLSLPSCKRLIREFDTDANGYIIL